MSVLIFSFFYFLCGL